jgi:hypothetical protein
VAGGSIKEEEVFMLPKKKKKKKNRFHQNIIRQSVSLEKNHERNYNAVPL